MIKFKSEMCQEAKELFPDFRELHESMTRGDSTKVLDLLYSKLNFIIDADDIIRAFRNKKEQDLLDQAKKAKTIRDFYQKTFAFIHKQEDIKAECLGYKDCI